MSTRTFKIGGGEKVALTQDQLMALAYMGRYSPETYFTAVEITTFLGKKSPGSVALLLNTLVKKGVLSRFMHQKSKPFGYQVTPRGRSILAVLRRHEAKAEKAASA